MSDDTLLTTPEDIATAVQQVLAESLAYLAPAALHTAVRLRIADHLADGPKTAAELAALTRTDALSLHRVLRFLAMRGVFRVDAREVFHLTPAAQPLRTDVPYSVAAAVELFTDKMYWRPAGHLVDTVRQGATVFPDAFGAPILDYVDTDDPPGQLFADAMDQVSTTEQDLVAACCDLPDTGTVVDVAGGRGGFLKTVLAQHPGLTGVLLERERVLRRHRLGEDPGIAGRWQTRVGDFYAAVPPGADVYVLKRILHDKSEPDILRILHTCREAMTPQSRLLVVDAVAPREEGGMPPAVALSDLLMLTVYEGRERTEAEYRDLLAVAGLRTLRVTPTPAVLSVIEAAA
ncbi:methyltransferase [Streptomyces sp. B1866]|uniref:methyltransferase n=1 Tax=Streptomyces sp. B1866 TaxID=3075431 RepID=UPI00288FD1D6|nr:methyltransferase [Streptomyces sp. B1866]MDT3395671.1 methyltransferase [Streptomyces sp. B1866]